MNSEEGEKLMGKRPTFEDQLDQDDNSQSRKQYDPANISKISIPQRRLSTRTRREGKDNIVNIRKLIEKE